jgi:flagellin
MTLRINQNIAAMNTHRVLQNTAKAQSGALEKLSSGLRINRASDDAAGLSISEKLRSQVRGLAQAERNAQDAISMVNVAEGAADEVHSILQRMRELAVQGTNDTLVTADRQAIGAEYDALRSEIDDLASKTRFNGQTMIADGGTTSFTYQVGFNASDTLTVTFAALKGSSDTASTTLGLGLTSVALNSTAVNGASFTAAISKIDTAIASVSNLRTNLGATVNRLESRIKSLAVGRENIAAAENRIRDTDMAAEMTEVSRRQILFQSGTSMLSQANSNPQSVMSLFR